MLENYKPYPLVEYPKGMTLISGVARSGTSLCTLILNNAGFKVFGSKWLKKVDEPEPHENEFVEQCRKYTLDKDEPAEIRAHRENKQREMNRSGFWEDGRFSVIGLNRNIETRKLIYDIQTSERPPAGKIVSQGLANTDPSLIGQIIYTIRNPHKVAKSQEQLKRGPEYINSEGIPMDATLDIKIHTPETYIRATYQACKWIVANPQVPIYFYNYDDLIDDPITILTEMDTFLKKHIGEDMAKHDIDIVKAGLNVIEPKSRRSEIEDIPNDLWGEAEFIYHKFNEGAAGNCEAFIEIIEYMERVDEREIHKQARQWQCFRADLLVNEEICRQCKSTPSVFIQGRIDSLRYMFVEWDKEPCMAECGMSRNIPEADYMTIAESIENNFWVDAIKESLNVPANGIRGNFIFKPFMKKKGLNGEGLIHEIDDENADRIVEHLCRGVPVGMIAEYLEAKEGDLVNFLRAKYGRFHLSAIIKLQQNAENFKLLNFKYHIEKHIKETDFTPGQSEDLNAFLKGLVVNGK